MKVALIDDHPLVREGLVSVLMLNGIEIIGQASTAREALELLSRIEPDITLMDLRLPDDNGLNVVSKAREKGCNCKFIVLTSSTNKQDFQKAYKIGVDGYLSKQALPEELISALQFVSRGRRYFDPELVHLIMENNREDTLTKLTDREREVLEVLGKGMNNREIAESLFITEFTVKKHISQIFSKLQLKDRTQAALYATKNDIL